MVNASCELNHVILRSTSVLILLFDYQNLYVFEPIPTKYNLFAPLRYVKLSSPYIKMFSVIMFVMSHHLQLIQWTGCVT